ncbi:PPE domain-containing protein [Nocardia panacis]|uniref:PPE domain-containing protein n=1 Tax=Nocardia panacis TaxID=2340916 RepID=A0A3A4L426_9NOCA|nr:PPE domain-containing protein [Nocardia panacis]RJO77073.1 PPE domain-containing protein [Nocardia panacis]
MTAGATGVFWLPRMAEGNSATLNTGAHAVPIYAASTAWGALTGAWIDATATVARVIAEVGVGLEGLNGLAVLGKLGGFTGWAEQQGVQAATMAAKTFTNANAYTIASIAMPNVAEIAVADGARVAAYSTGGVLNGSAEAAEAAKAALDLRAAMTMETYEAATTATVATPTDFIQPPTIAAGAGRADAPPPPQAQADPIQAAISAAGAFINNPAVASIATQAANVVGSLATTGVSTVGTAASSALSAATSMAAAPAMSAAAPATMTLMGGGMAAGVAAVAGGSTRTAASVSVGSLKLPAGWGAGAGAPAAGAAPGSPESDNPAVARVEMRQPNASAPGNPLLGRQVHEEQEAESLHKTPGYLRGDNFTDGRCTADGVIGGDPAGPAK